MNGNSSMITLSEYSFKYRVSTSTLRRKIKAGVIEATLYHGKYFLEDKPLLRSKPNHMAPPHNNSHDKVSTNSDSTLICDERGLSPNSDLGSEHSCSESSTQEQSLLARTATSMLDEIKSAYKATLLVKDAQIASLNHQVADLRTLIRVLEAHLSTLDGEAGKREDATTFKADDALLDSLDFE